MDFSHYTGEPVDLSVSLMNTRGRSTDSLESLIDLEAFLDPYRHMWEGVARPPTDRDLKAVKGLRETLRGVVAAQDEREAADLLNDILTKYDAQPRLSVHNGVPHLHFEPFGSDMVSWLAATTAMALATVIVEHGIDRFGICAAADCDDVYVDASRNRSRRHCSSTCSTREAVSAYRRRQADEA
jgi:predicted RNA-binding Zn ribbon-like protein